jgi:hypothetical protein
MFCKYLNSQRSLQNQRKSNLLVLQKTTSTGSMMTLFSNANPVESAFAMYKDVLVNKVKLISAFPELLPKNVAPVIPGTYPESETESEEENMSVKTRYIMQNTVNSTRATPMSSALVRGVKKSSERKDRQMGTKKDCRGTLRKIISKKEAKRTNNKGKSKALIKRYSSLPTAEVYYL